MDDIERCARLMGMKRTEVQEVVPASSGHDLVRTHDGAWTLLRDNGVATRVDEAEAAMLRGFHGEPEPELASGGIVKNPGPVLVGEQGAEDLGPLDAHGKQRVAVASKRRGRA